MSKLFITICAIGLSALAACGPRSEARDQRGITRKGSALTQGASNTLLCAATTRASEGGLAALQVAVLSTDHGQEFWKSKAASQTSVPVARFAGTENVGKVCWAYAQGAKHGAGALDMVMWRCPVSVVRNDGGKSDNLILEDVSSQECEFGVTKGLHSKYELSKSITVLSF